MSASSRDLSIPDGLILFLPAVPGMLFLYIAEVIPKVCAGLELELGLSGYALLEAVFIGCALSPAAGLPLYCWYFFRRGLGSNPVYPALFYLAQSFLSLYSSKIRLFLDSFQSKPKYFAKTLYLYCRI